MMDPLLTDFLVNLGASSVYDLIGFLCKQSKNLIKRHMEKKKRLNDTDILLKRKDVPSFLQAPLTCSIDETRLAQDFPRLVDLKQSLERYMKIHRKALAPDSAIIEQIITLQKLIEGIYGCAFTKKPDSSNSIEADHKSSIMGKKVEQTIKGAGKTTASNTISAKNGSRIKIGSVNQKIEGSSK